MRTLLEPNGAVARAIGEDRAGSSGRRNTSTKEVAVDPRRRRSDRCRRGALRSPGRPSVARREDRRQFWVLIAAGRSSEGAAACVGGAPALGARWVRGGGGGGGGGWCGGGGSPPPPSPRVSAKPVFCPPFFVRGAGGDRD